MVGNINWIFKMLNIFILFLLDQVNLGMFIKES